MTEHLRQTSEEMETIFLDSLPIEKRLRGIPPEELLKGLTAEERSKAVTAEAVLHGMSAEELERLRQLLEYWPPKPASGE